MVLEKERLFQFTESKKILYDFWPIDISNCFRSKSSPKNIVLSKKNGRQEGREERWRAGLTLNNNWRKISSILLIWSWIYHFIFISQSVILIGIISFRIFSDTVIDIFGNKILRHIITNWKNQKKKVGETE